MPEEGWSMSDERAESIDRALGRVEAKLEAIERDMLSLPAIEARLAQVEIAQTSLATDMAGLKPAVEQVNDVFVNAGAVRKAAIWIFGAVAVVGFWRIIDFIDKGIDMLRTLGR